MRQQTFDALISGFGPVGAVLAGLLGQRGLRVAVFDRLPDLYPMPRAIGLDHEAMRIVQELGAAGRMDGLIAPYQPSEYRGMDGRLIKRLDTIAAPYPLAWAPNYVFTQPGFERVIRERIAELPSVQTWLETEVLACGQDVEQAWVEVRRKGEPETVCVTGRYLIACDGGSSPIRKQLGIELEDLGFDEPWLVVDAIVPDEKLADLPQTQVQYCEAQRPATFVVGPGNHRRWEIMLEPGEHTGGHFPDEALWPLLARWIQPGEAQLLRRAAYRFHGLVARAWRQGRILLAGDAAHMTPPFMAQGMVQGLRDAHNLAWKLDRVIRGQSPDRLLETYFEERSPHVRQTTLTAMALGRVICERDADKARARDTALRAQHGAEVKTEYRQDMIPGLRGGLLDASTSAAGVVFPQPMVHGGDGLVRMDDLVGTRPLIVILGALGSDVRSHYLALAGELDAQIVEVVAGSAAPSVPPAGSPAVPIRVSEQDALLRDWLARHGAAVALVRPDRYTYGTAGSHADGLRLLQHFKRDIT